MDIRSVLKNREKEYYRKMSLSKRLKYAIELSEFVQNLSQSVKLHGKRIQRYSKGSKRGKAS